MHMPLSRRAFLAATAAAVAARPLLAADAAKPAGPFKISLAQWSIHTALQKKTMDPLDFAKVAHDAGCTGVEYVNQFYTDKATDAKYHAEMKKRADDLGVRHVLIMCDREGDLGNPDEGKRKLAVTNHHKWVDLAKYLGCHSIRVNAASDKKLPRDEQAKLAADGLRRLTEYGAAHGINVIVENHGGLSSHGDWLAGVIKAVGSPHCGTLPDFGNFTEYDRYKGVQEMMPFAKGVSAKSYDFDAAGNETKIDYKKMMQIVKDAGYRGYVGIEYEGKKLGEIEGIAATKKLLDRVIAELA